VTFPASLVTEPIAAAISASSLATFTDSNCLPPGSTTQTQ
jgi:hypothetical protein